jgi:hypothetical protein
MMELRLVLVLNTHSVMLHGAQLQLQIRSSSKRWLKILVWRANSSYRCVFQLSNGLNVGFVINA